MPSFDLAGPSLLRRFLPLEAFHRPRFTNQSPSAQSGRPKRLNGPETVEMTPERSYLQWRWARYLRETQMTVLCSSMLYLDWSPRPSQPPAFFPSHQPYLSLSFLWPHVGLIALFNLTVLPFPSCWAFSQGAFLQSCFSMPASPSPWLVSWHQSQRMASTTGHLVLATAI